MHQQEAMTGIGEVLETAIANSNGLELKPTPPAMKFVGFKVEAVPAGRLTADIRGRIDEEGVVRGVTSWQSGIAIIAPDDISLGESKSNILKASKFYRWVLNPGRLVELKRDRNGKEKPFNGIRLNARFGFTLPQILPALRVRMYCPCEGLRTNPHKDSFYTWNAALARSYQLDEEGKTPFPPLPRLRCNFEVSKDVKCGMRLNPKTMYNQHLLETGEMFEDAGYADENHNDLDEFTKAYHDDPKIGADHVFPRLWAVYDAHMVPDIGWKATDDLAAEIHARYLVKGKAIRPLSVMIASGGQPAPKSFVIEASNKMKFGWLTEGETMKCVDKDYFRKSLVPKPELEPEAKPRAENRQTIEADAGV